MNGSTQIKKTALVILDGWGIGNRSESDAIYRAQPDFYNKLLKEYPHSTLTTHGNAVGLPEGQMGNSEVGHINLGAGRVVWQMLEKINRAFKKGALEDNPVFIETIKKAEENKRPIHVMGLISDGGVHSSLNHVVSFLKAVKRVSHQPVVVHAFLDGRDTDPKSGIRYLEQLKDTCKETGARIASVIGRYYAMDRDQRWERTKKAYDLMVHGKGKTSEDVLDTIAAYYAEGITDEFMEPIQVGDPNSEPTLIREGDIVFNLNFRTDRPRQITDMLVERDIHDAKKLNLEYVAMTRYDEKFKHIKVLFEEENVQNTLGEYLAESGVGQLRAAETEKYPHVTFFFSGGREEPFQGEERVLANSPKVATYDLKPEMSAPELTEGIIPFFSRDISFMCINYANADMVGHTGVYEAIQEAIKTVDTCLEKLVNAGLKQGWQFVVIADHGNADFAINSDGSPNTQHSLNPVPCILIGAEEGITLREGILADVAPTSLDLM